MESRKSCNMAWAEFIHRTTRPVDGIPDPQLHIHAVAANASFDPVERQWKAAEFSDLVSGKGYYQSAFLSRLARKLSALGYGVERDGKRSLPGAELTPGPLIEENVEAMALPAKKRSQIAAKGAKARWKKPPY